MCLVPFITWVEDQLIVRHHEHLQLWIIILEATGKSHKCHICSFQEEDNDVVQRVNELTEFVQSEEELEVSGASSLQESADPPMIHYADDEHDEEGHLWQMGDSVMRMT